MLDAFEAAFLQHPAEVEPLFDLLLGELQKQGLEAHRTCTSSRSTRTVPRPCCTSRATVASRVVGEVLRTGYRGRAGCCARRW